MPRLPVLANSLIGSLDGVVLAAGWLLVAAMLGLPVLGWVFLVIDVRRFLRALRARALVLIGYVAPNQTPYWTLFDRPNCLRELGVSLPCSEEELLAAYRSKVKNLHPDRGGEMHRFLRLQKHFEQALHLVRQQQSRN